MMIFPSSLLLLPIAFKLLAFSPHWIKAIDLNLHISTSFLLVFFFFFSFPSYFSFLVSFLVSILMIESPTEKMK